ncbi:multidrug efflux SMR transporter [Janthinobacterium lividum]|nr:multidrug efflux SMR transporter [Janthinobacterium lividum]
MNSYVYLILAILGEVGATSALKASHGFSKPWPSLACVLGYVISFYFLSLTLKTLPIGIAYAVWAGVGIVLTAAIGYFVFGQKLDVAAMLGIALIVAGVLTIQLFSGAGSH